MQILKNMQWQIFNYFLQGVLPSDTNAFNRVSDKAYHFIRPCFTLLFSTEYHKNDSLGLHINWPSGQ